jgi:hypothetical protein
VFEFLFTRVYVRTTRVYYLLCCCCCSSCCSSWDISQNTAVYTKLVPFHHAFSILQGNLQFAICNLQFAILIFNFNFRFSIFDFYLISLLRPISPISPCFQHFAMQFAICNLQFAIFCKQFATCNFNFRYYDQFRPDCPIQLKILHYCPISPCF